MGFDQYHEPADELSQETRTFARMIASLTEEAEAINWYEQRISVEKNRDARAIMQNAQQEEFKHFGMDLEFLLRQKPKWRIALQKSCSKTATSWNMGKRRRRPRTNNEGGCSQYLPGCPVRRLDNKMISFRRRDADAVGYLCAD